jgi:hypothetical protein
LGFHNILRMYSGVSVVTKGEIAEDLFRCYLITKNKINRVLVEFVVRTFHTVKNSSLGTLSACFN